MCSRISKLRGSVPEASANYFAILLTGSFSKKQLAINWEPDRRELPVALKELIESNWELEVAQAAKRSFLFNGDLCRLEAWRVKSAVLTLDLALTDYSELLYSNRCSQRIAREFGKPYLSNALGVSSVVRSSDAQIILIERSENVGECPEMLDVLGGHVDPKVHLSGGLPSPFSAIKEELTEELNLSLTDDESLTCLGLIVTKTTRKPELIFAVDCPLAAEEIVRAACEKKSSEISRFVPITVDSLTSFVRSKSASISPSALGALHLYEKSLVA